jgi:hypothetical protein
MVRTTLEVRRPSLAGPFTCLRIASSGKGIVLLHDFQHATAEAAMDLLNDLKAGGYKVVFMKPKFLVTTIALISASQRCGNRRNLWTISASDASSTSSSPTV